MTPQEVMKKYLGVPFKNKGRDIKGLDCYGLVVSIFKDLSLDLYDPEIDYDAKWSYRGRNHFLENHWRDWSETDRPKPFDVICFNNSVGIGYHIGVVMDANLFIHAVKAGVVLGRIPEWRGKVRGFFRHRALVDRD